MVRTLLSFVIAAFVLGGCAHKPEPKTKYVTMESAWLVPCPLLAPPESVAYQSATLRQRTEMWSAIYLKQAKVQAGCNIRLDQAAKYNLLKQTETAAPK